MLSGVFWHKIALTKGSALNNMYDNILLIDDILYDNFNSMIAENNYTIYTGFFDILIENGVNWQIDTIDNSIINISS